MRLAFALYTVFGHFDSIIIQIQRILEYFQEKTFYLFTFSF